MLLTDTIFAGGQAIVLLFAACELSQRINNAYSEVDSIFNQFAWYLFPNEVRRILPTIIMYIQEPVELKFFGNLSCSRDQYKRVRTNHIRNV